MRTKIINQFETELEASGALKNLNSAKGPEEMISTALDAADYAAGMMIKFDKNREKSTLMEYIA